MKLGTKTRPMSRRQLVNELNTVGSVIALAKKYKVTKGAVYHRMTAFGIEKKFV